MKLTTGLLASLTFLLLVGCNEAAFKAKSWPLETVNTNFKATSGRWAYFEIEGCTIGSTRVDSATLASLAPGDPIQLRIRVSPEGLVYQPQSNSFCQTGSGGKIVTLASLNASQESHHMFASFSFGPLFAGIFVGLLALWGLFTLFFIVKPREVATVTRFGKYVRSGRSGLNLKIPFYIEQVDKRLDTSLLQDAAQVRVKSSDNAYVDMPVQIYYQVDDASAETIYQAAYALQDAPQQILQLASKVVRSHASGMTLDELFQDKATIEESVKDELEHFVSSNGWIIANVVLDEPTPSEEVQRASNDVIASLRLQDAATAKAEAIRIERVGEARADAEALKERANAFADSRKTIADGMTTAAQSVQGKLDLTSEQIVQVLEGVDWRDALISCSKGPGTLIIDSNRQDHGLAGTAGLVRALNKPGEPVVADEPGKKEHA